MTSIDYYNENAKEFIRSTFQADMRELLEQFAAYLPPGARVLDVGCGSGRDCLWFQSQGFDVYAHDASDVLVDHCQEFLGERVICATFEEYQTDLSFDGIWACSSLLHVQRKDLPGILTKYAGFLKPGGAFFMSFKRREEDHKKDGRHFTNMTEDGLAKLISDIPGLILEKIIITSDVRKGREEEGWVSAIAKRTK
ncbi:class I SAM-dependent methyltransferase [Alkalibacter rhizosphaerae]|uniref:Class I SAM-dependent methyltransferase n=1 Tax=Alkalibacter rhizosphaerae TaxID=2815577 RepID=A0A975AHP2_9FIRM|nr:class I SAM-dependent methyltransferase [Alkalibacter rhizosphaerae]QSX07824.1 class I SAM-dependent methyltransferase [Alkalibacter rhizosphaerae]